VGTYRHQSRANPKALIDADGTPAISSTSRPRQCSALVHLQVEGGGRPTNSPCEICRVAGSGRCIANSQAPKLTVVRAGGGVLENGRALREEKTRQSGAGARQGNTWAMLMPSSLRICRKAAACGATRAPPRFDVSGTDLIAPAERRTQRRPQITHSGLPVNSPRCK